MSNFFVLFVLSLFSCFSLSCFVFFVLFVLSLFSCFSLSCFVFFGLFAFSCVEAQHQSVLQNRSLEPGCIEHF